MIVTFQITDVDPGYNNWSGTIEVSSFSNVVKNDASVIITIDGTGYTFETDNIYGWPDDNSGLNDDYVTWRTQVISTQYPTSGKSIDIWSYNLYQDIFVNNFTWTSLASPAGYILNDVKHTLVYDYDVPYAPYYSRNGKITFIV